MCDEIVLDISQGRYVGSTDILYVFPDHIIGTLSKNLSTIDSSRMTRMLLGAVVSVFSHNLATAQVQV